MEDRIDSFRHWSKTKVARRGIVIFGGRWQRRTYEYNMHTPASAISKAVSIFWRRTNRTKFEFARANLPCILLGLKPPFWEHLTWNENRIIFAATKGLNCRRWTAALHSTITLQLYTHTRCSDAVRLRSQYKAPSVTRGWKSPCRRTRHIE